MRDSVTVRPAQLADVPGIQGVHANCDDPWADLAQCAVWVNHRLLRGFLIDVALIGKRVVGHAEWIVSDEPPPYGRHLYLGMIQVHSDYQRRSVGGTMIESGVQKARGMSCPALRTVPEDEAKGFYRKCEFSFYAHTVTYTANVFRSGMPSHWRRVQGVPRKVLGRLPMRSGWMQASSRHMWETCNRGVRVAGEHLQHPSAGRADGRAYVQLRYLGEGSEAWALSWAPEEEGLDETVRVAMALGGGLPVKRITFTVAKNEAQQLAACCKARQVGVGEVWSRSV